MGSSTQAPQNGWEGPISKLLRGPLNQHSRIRIADLETEFLPFLARWVKERSLAARGPRPRCAGSLPLADIAGALPESLPQQILDLAVDAAQFRGRQPLELCPHLRVDAQQECFLAGTRHCRQV